MSTRFSRPSGAYDSTSVTTNKDKYQDDKVAGTAIASAKVDGDVNYIIDAVNALDDDITSVVAGSVTNDSITDAKLRNSAALSVIGRSANSSGDPADIVAGAANEVLRVNSAGSVLGFGTIGTGSIEDSAITSGKIAANAVTNAKISSTLLNNFTAVTSLSGADQLPFSDDSNSGTNSKITFTNFIASLRTSAAATTTDSGLVELATAAEVVSETSSKVPTADILKNHPGVAKAWAMINGDRSGSGASPSVTEGYNISSVTKLSGTGHYRVDLDVTMSSANYCVTTGTNIISGTSPFGASIEVEKDSMTTTSFEIYATDTNSAEHPYYFWVAVHGTLA